MKLRAMLENCFSFNPDQIAWRMEADNGDYEIVDFPDYMTKFIPGGVVYITDCEIKDWRWDVRNCRLYVDLCEEEKPLFAVKNEQEDLEEDEEDDDEEEDDDDDEGDDEGDWDIKVKLSDEAGSTTWTKTYTNTSFNRVVGYYNTMIDQLNNGRAFIRFPDNGKNQKDIAMASSQIMYIIIERSK